MALDVAILDASGDHDPAARNFRRELDASLSVFDAPAGELPDPSGFDAAVVSGSWASVYWDLDWLDPLARWATDAAAADLPLLGVCFGHQLLATVLGGEVVGRDAYELGYHTVERTGDGPLFAGVPRSFVAFTAHSDDVVRAPPGATVLARNDYSLHSFRREDVFGVQFHPEFDFETAERVAATRTPSEERTPDAVGSLTPQNYAAAARTKRVLDNFVAFAADRPPQNSGSSPS